MGLPPSSKDSSLFQRGKLDELLRFPYLQELGPVLCSPLPHQSQSPRRQIVLQHVEGSDIDCSDVLSVHGMEVGRGVPFPLKKHFDDHSVKSGYDRRLNTNLRLKGKKGPPARGAAPKGLGGVFHKTRLLTFPVNASARQSIALLRHSRPTQRRNR